MGQKLDMEEILQTLDDLSGDILLTELLVRGIQERSSEVRSFSQKVVDELMFRLMDHSEQHVLELQQLLNPEERG